MPSFPFFFSFFFDDNKNCILSFKKSSSIVSFIFNSVAQIFLPCSTQAYAILFQSYLCTLLLMPKRLPSWILAVGTLRILELLLVQKKKQRGLSEFRMPFLLIAQTDESANLVVYFSQSALFLIYTWCSFNTSAVDIFTTY